jgi:hypothetical protein
VIADFRDFLSALNTFDVRYIVVGAHALAAHGVPRVTGDLDVWVAATEVNASRIWAALAHFGAPLASLSIHESDFVRPDCVVQLGLPPYRIDIMTAISGVEFSNAWERRVFGQLFDVEVSFLSRADFMQNKRASGRPKDLEDIRSLGA